MTYIKWAFRVQKCQSFILFMVIYLEDGQLKGTSHVPSFRRLLEGKNSKVLEPGLQLKTHSAEVLGFDLFYSGKIVLHDGSTSLLLLTTKYCSLSMKAPSYYFERY